MPPWFGPAWRHAFHMNEMFKSERRSRAKSRLEIWLSRFRAKEADRALQIQVLQQRLKAAEQNLIAQKRRVKLAEQASLEQNRQIFILEGIARKLMKQHGCLCLLPPPELRMNVGRVADVANFLGQGMASSARVVEVFGEDPGGPVLDWGCGSGRTLNWLIGVGRWRKYYRGCDVDGDAIAWLRSRKVRPVVSCGDLPPLPYPDESLVGLFSFSVLTHIHPERHRAWYEEFRRVLKPGGRAYVTVNGDAGVFDRKTFSQEDRDLYAERGWYFSERPGHYKDAAAVSRRFSMKAVEGLFEVEEYRESGYNKMDDFILRKA